MNKDLLSATAVFAELVNNNIDYKEILNEFIISTFRLDNEFAMDSQKITQSLTTHYDFKIPEAVIKGQLNILFKKNILDYKNGNYIVSHEVLEKQTQVRKELIVKEKIHVNIIDELIRFIKESQHNLTPQQINEIDTYFVSYLFDNSFNGEYSSVVSKFILKKSSDKKFTHELNLIREGIIILKGLQYSSEKGDTLDWTKELHIYLDTEHLFNINGYNGELFQQITTDFYDLVRDLNNLLKNKKIHLKYFVGANEEIVNFFHTAKDIYEKKRTLDIANQAMKHILKDVNHKSDIIKKETRFFENLKTRGIFMAEETILDEEDLRKYNVESLQLLEKYSSTHNEKKIIDVLKTFTNINYLRKGKNNRNIESIGHILVSGDNLTKKLSKDIDTKVSETDFSFSTDIYYLTHRLWFKVNKGFGFKKKAPATLNIVSKAQILLSKKLNNVVSERFEAILQDINNGVRTEEEIKSYYLKLRANSINPEDLNFENIEEKTKILFENEDLENHLKQESLIRNELSELKKYKENAEQEKKISTENRLLEQKKIENTKIKKRNKWLNKKIIFVNILFYIIPVLVLFLIIYLRKDDDIWDIIDTIIYIVPFIFWLGFFKLKKKIINSLQGKKLEEIV